MRRGRSEVIPTAPLAHGPALAKVSSAGLALKRETLGDCSSKIYYKSNAPSVSLPTTMKRYPHTLSVCFTKPFFQSYSTLG